MNPAQLEAVTHGTGPMLVLAGAGSGKTRVLTHRIANMIIGDFGRALGGVWPQEIMAVTFTNKAAKEMRHRIGQLVGEEQAKNLWMGTFHSICGRILRREIPYYQTPNGRKWSGNFVIYDEDESNSAIKEVLKAQNLDEKLYPVRGIKSQISALKNAGITAYQYASNAKDFKAERLAGLFDGYEEVLSRNNALDFDDLLLITTKLFRENPALLDRYHSHFKHLLVDEFQDTNDVQYELIRLLALGPQWVLGELDPTDAAFWQRRSLTVVGDVDQSIYSWRGANFRIILNFQKDLPQARLVKLLHNYRSTENILTVANTIIENNTERLPKELVAVKGAGAKVHLFEATDDREEALHVVDRLLAVTRDGRTKPGDCAILYRTNVQSRAIEDVLIARGLPYTMIGGLKFYERREIKDVMAYLTVLFNDQDSYSIKRILNVPKRAIGKTSIEHIEKAAKGRNISFFEMLRCIDLVEEVKGKARTGVIEFVQLIDRLKATAAQNVSVDDMMLAIRAQSGYDDALRVEEPEEAENRIANMDELINVARQFHNENPEGTLADFLTQMALLSDIDSAEPVENKFVMMTLHASKGLEYPVVVMCGMEEGLFPHSRTLNEPDQMEEERRLMYVGVTRAMEQLYMTYARRRMTFGEVKYTQPSRFLKEIPPDLLTGSFALDSEGRKSAEIESTLRGSRWDKGGRSGGDSRSSFGNAAAGGSISRSQTTPRASGPEKIRLSGTRDYDSSHPPDDFGAPPPSLGKPKVSPSAAAGGDSAAPVPSFKVGQRVRHPKFGDGTVEQVLDNAGKKLYNIQFDCVAGKKLMDPRHAKLESL
jgi:DNA helicase-2/ATP-dependent DNA helicase PcrA